MPKLLGARGNVSRIRRATLARIGKAALEGKTKFPKNELAVRQYNSFDLRLLRIPTRISQQGHSNKDWELVLTPTRIENWCSHGNVAHGSVAHGKVETRS